MRLWLAGLRMGSGVARFGIAVPRRTHVRLDVYDVLGRRVRSLLERDIEAGQSVVTWDGQAHGRPVPSDVYFAKLTTPYASSVVRVPMLR